MSQAKTKGTKMIHTDGTPTIAHYGVGDGKSTAPKTETPNVPAGLRPLAHGGDVVGFVTPEFKALLDATHKAAIEEIEAARTRAAAAELGTLETAKVAVQGAATGFALMSDRTFTGAEVADILRGATEGI